MATLNSKTWDIVPRADGKLYMEDGLASSPGSWTSRGAWVTLSLLRQIPQSGAAWTRLEAAALGDWGTADLSALDNDHDVLTLAGALYAAVTDDVTVRTKVVNALHEAVASPLATVLELARGMQSYVLAADIIAHRGAYFYDRVAAWVDLPLNGHSTANSLRETAQRSANNWGGHSRASLAAAALYLEDATMLADVVQAHEEFIGTYAGGTPQMVFTDTAWHHDALDKAGVNRLDAGVLSGVLPEEWRRDTLFDPTTVTTLADLNAVNSIYLWEGIQGFIVTAVLLHRYGAADITDGDNAVERALDVLVNTAHPALGDDRWIPFLANEYIVGATYDESAGIQEGKGMGWTDFTSQAGPLYDLSGIPTRFQAVEFADQPVTTNSVTVNNQAELNAALVSGNQITVNPAGSYSSLAMPQDVTLTDVEIIATGATFSGGIQFDPRTSGNLQRIKLTGGTFGGQLMWRDRASHITVDNVRVNAGGMYMDSFNSGDTSLTNHITVLNSTIISNANGNYGYLGAISHFIVANCDIQNYFSTQAGMRIAGGDNVIVIDSRIYTQGNRIIRRHDDDMLLFYNCQLESTGDNNIWLGPVFDSLARITRVEFESCRYYAPQIGISGAVMQSDSDVGAGIDDVIFRNNTFYSPDSSPITGNPPTNFQDIGNTFPAYQTPPAFTGGADH